MRFSERHIQKAVLHAADAKVIEEGKLGPDVSFEIFSDGNMVVSGHGEITETTEDIKNRDSVVSIVFKNDLKGSIISDIKRNITLCRLTLTA